MVSHFICNLSESLPHQVLKLSSLRLAKWPNLQQIYGRFNFTIKYKLTRDLFFVIPENSILEKQHYSLPLKELHMLW